MLLQVSAASTDKRLLTCGTEGAARAHRANSAVHLHASAAVLFCQSTTGKLLRTGQLGQLLQSLSLLVMQPLKGVGASTKSNCSYDSYDQIGRFGHDAGSQFRGVTGMSSGTVVVKAAPSVQTQVKFLEVATETAWWFSDASRTTLPSQNPVTVIGWYPSLPPHSASPGEEIWPRPA